MMNTQHAIVDTLFKLQDNKGEGPIWLQVLPYGELHNTRKGIHLARFYDVQYLEEVASETMRALSIWSDIAAQNGHAPYKIPLLVEHNENGVSWGDIDLVKVLSYKGNVGLWARTNPSPALRLALLLGLVKHISPYIKHDYMLENGEMVSPFLREVSFTATPLIKRLGSIDDYNRATLQAAITLAVSWALHKGDDTMNEQDLAALEELIARLMKPAYDAIATMQGQLDSMNEAISAMSTGDDSTPADTQAADDEENADTQAGDDVQAGDDEDKDLAANDNGGGVDWQAFSDRLAASVQDSIAPVTLQLSQMQAQITELQANDGLGSATMPPNPAQKYPSIDAYIQAQVAAGKTHEQAARMSMTDPLCPSE